MRVIFKLIENDGKLDRMMMAKRLLDRICREILQYYPKYGIDQTDT